MYFLDLIVRKLHDASSFFYELYLECYYSWYIPNAVANLFYSLSSLFHSLAQYFYYFNDWVVDISSKVVNVLDYYHIYSYFREYFYAAYHAWRWVQESIYYITNIINSWWSSTQYTVKVWIDAAIRGAQGLVGQLETWLGYLQSAWDNFKGRIPSIDEIISWFANWWGKILANIIAWGALPGILISTLIDSKIRDWFPFYNDLAALWGDIVLFFTDPLQWLYDRAEEFFERFW